MVDALTDDLIILFNFVQSIRTSVYFEINRFNERSFNQKSDEVLMKFKSSLIESEGAKLMNDAESKHEDILNQKNESISNTSSTLKELDLFGTKNNDVLKTLKLKLKDSLKFVELLRQNVTEQILMANNERIPVNSKGDNEINSDSKVASRRNSIKENVESTENCIEDLKRNSLDKEENNLPFILKREPSETLAETSDPNRSAKIHENVMISLISDDDDSDTDCIEISTKDDNLDSSNITNSSIIPDQFVSVKLENISNFQSNNNTNHKSSNEINETVTEQRDNKSSKRKLDDNEKSSKKKKKSRDKIPGLISSAPVNMFGNFPKVKLSNLSVGITYAEIASLLQNSGLEYLDILLMNVGDKCTAEVSFADMGMKEKALGLDPPLFHAGSKIRIKPL